MSAPERTAGDLLGQVLGDRYRLLRPLGHGGMATIYEAEHVLIEKRVAVKVLAPEQARCGATAQRFLREAKAASRLRHEHIVDITDFGHARLPDGAPVVYFAMECLEGEDLAATLEHDGPLRWTRVLQIAKQVCQVLVAAHDQGIVHCDIKPANCFRIVRNDTADFIKVLDFGVASFACQQTGKCMPEAAANEADPGASGSGRRSAPRLGTPGYMAGELLSGGPYDHRVDIYALGVLMYRLLTNKMPYPAARLYGGGDMLASVSGPALSGSFAGMSGEGSGATPLAPFPMRRAIPTLEISPAFEALVLKAVAQDPDQRFQSARALLAALEEVERASTRSSPLPRDPLCWGDELAEGSETARDVAASDDLERTDPDLLPSRSSPAWQGQAWPPARARPWRVAMLAALAAVATSAVVRVAWALSG